MLNRRLPRVLTTILLLAGLCILPVQVRAASLTVTWFPNSEKDLAGYKVYYGTASGQYGVPVEVDASTTSFQITGLRPNVKYYVALTASNLVAESGFSDEASATTFGLVVVANVQALPNIWDAKLTWTPSKEIGVVGYRIYCGKQTGVYSTPMLVMGATSSECVIKDLFPSTTYYARVEVFDASGNVAKSTEITFTTKQNTVPPNPPKGVTVVPVTE